MKRLLYPLLCVAAVSLSACATRPSNPEAAAWASSEQVVRVIVKDWTDIHGELQRYQRVHGEWVAVGAPVNVVIGRTGSAWGSGLNQATPMQGDPVKREGDGKAPAGVFKIGPAFGYANSLNTGLNYLPMTTTHYCMDVPASPLYNQIVDAKRVGETAVIGSSERMRLDLVKLGDMRYERGFVIEHNANAVPGRGSCIFAHQWKGPDAPTAGCTAMTAENMATLTAWLDRHKHPVFVLMPEAAYRAVSARWDMPALEVQP